MDKGEIIFKALNCPQKVKGKGKGKMRRKRKRRKGETRGEREENGEKGEKGGKGREQELKKEDIERRVRMR